MLEVFKSSLGWHSCLDLESDSVSKWISWESWSSCVKVPSHSHPGSASVESNVIHVSVVVTIDSKA